MVEVRVAPNLEELRMMRAVVDEFCRSGGGRIRLFAGRVARRAWARCLPVVGSADNELHVMDGGRFEVLDVSGQAVGARVVGKRETLSGELELREGALLRKNWLLRVDFADGAGDGFVARDADFVDDDVAAADAHAHVRGMREVGRTRAVAVRKFLLDFVVAEKWISSGGSGIVTFDGLVTRTNSMMIRRRHCSNKRKKK